MTNARGDEAKLLARLQGAFGTAEAAGDGEFYALPFYSYDNAPSEELNEDEAIQGDAFPGDAVAGLRNLTGSMVVPIGLNSFGWHLAALLGAPVTTELSVGKYSHVFTATGAPGLALLTHGISHTRIAQHFVQDSLAYSGMELQARKNGERARATINLIGREETPGGAVLDATPVMFAPDPVPVGFTSRVLVNDVEAAAVTGVSMTLNSGVEADQETLNGLATAAAIDQGRWDLSGSIDTRFKDRTWYDRGNAGTSIALHLAWQLGADYELEIVAHDIRVERTGVPISGREILSTSFNYRANRPAPGVPLVTVTLRNTVSDYANPA